MKSVVLCGSRRFKKEIRKLEKKLQEKGIIVYAPFLNMNRGIDTLELDLKRYAFTGLTLHHLEYIRKADVVFIYNKNGYMGNSSTMELGAAVVLGKPIYALEDDNTEMCRKVVFDKIVSPSQLIKLLK
jgi:nucleoside 2-deoxyribosyltransferase